MANYKLITHTSQGQTSEEMFEAGATNTVVSSITAKDGSGQTAEVLVQKASGSVTELAEVDLTSNGGHQIIDVAFALEAGDKVYIRSSRGGMKFIMSYVEETDVPNDTNLGGLADVDTTGITDGQVLAYSTGAGVWQPVAAGSSTGGGADELDDLDDVTVAGASSGDILLHNGNFFLNTDFGSAVSASTSVFNNTTKLNHITVTQAVDLDQMESDIAAVAGGHYTSSDFDADLAGKDTGDLAEGSNLYYTEARVSANTDVVANSNKVSYTDGAQVSANTTKLSGIDAGATANDTDANLKDRANHTGTQTAASISDFTAEVEDIINDQLGNTGDLTEGSNLYYTDARVDARIGVAKIEDLDEVSSTVPSIGQVLKWDGSEWAPAADNSSTGGAGGVVDSVNGISQAAVILGTDNIAEGTTNLYYTDNRSDARIAAADLQDIGNVDVPTAGEFLKWNGNTWETDAVSTGTPVASLTNHYRRLKLDAQYLSGGASEININAAPSVLTGMSSVDSAGSHIGNTTSRISVTADGLYTFNAIVEVLCIDLQRHVPEVRFKLNGTTVLDGAGMGYARLSSGADEATASLSRTMSLSNGDYVELVVGNIGNGLTNSSLIANLTDVTFECHSNAVTVTGASGSGGVVDSVNGISQAAVVLDADDIDDTSTTHKYTTAGDITKLAGIASNATANDTDANLKNRGNHTGSQDASTISDFDTAADARITAADLADLNNVSATSPAPGEVLKWNGSAWAPGTDNSGSGGGAVDSVNTQTGVVVLDADDIDDASTTHKFVAQGDLDKLGHISVTQAVDLDSIETSVSTNAAGVLAALSTAQTASNAVNSHVGSIENHADVTFQYTSQTGQPLSRPDGSFIRWDLSSGRWQDVDITVHDGNYNTLTNVPATFAPSAHTHVAADITDFNTAVDARIPASSTTVHDADSSLPFNGSAGAGVEKMDFTTTNLSMIAGRLYKLGSTGWEAVSNADSSLETLIAVCPFGDSDGSNMILKGAVRVDLVTSSASIGDPVYLGTGSKFVLSAPTSNAHVMKMGYVLDTSGKIFFDPDSTSIKIQ